MMMWPIRYETASPDSDTDTDVGLEVVVTPETELDPPYDIFIHNDDVTPMDFVVMVLRSIFKLSIIDANGVMLTAHYDGVAYVMTLPLEEAKHRVGKAHGAARVEGYPLTFTIEPSE